MAEIAYAVLIVVVAYFAVRFATKKKRDKAGSGESGPENPNGPHPGIKQPK